jgi:hypothetical protein
MTSADTVSSQFTAPDRPPPVGSATAPSTPKPPRPPRTHRRVTHRLTTALSVTTPAIRTLVIVVSAERSSTHVELVPAVGLEARVIRSYSRALPIGQTAETAPDHAGMIRAGWSYESEAVERDVLIVDPEFGVQPAEELYDDVCNVAFRIVACPWDPAEDQERLLSAIEKVQVEATERDAAWRARSGMA